MYGESKSTATENVPQLIERSGGFEFDLTHACPASDLDCFFGGKIPRHFHTLEDVTGDGVNDHRFVTVLLPVDRDGNGVLERDVDGALLVVRSAEAIQDGVQVQSCLVVRRRVASKVLRQFSGADRNVSLIQDRR